MKRLVIASLLLTAYASACKPTPEAHGEHEGHEHKGGDHDEPEARKEGEHEEHAGHKEGEPGEEHEDEGEHEEHGGEVRVSPEAAKRAGIVVGKAERRALTGGTAIPAEVQFEPSSTAHVSPLVPGRISKVVVALGDHVKRGQLLATVASTDVSTARAKLEQSRARLTGAESTLLRQQQLSKEGIGAQRALVEAEALAGELRAEVEGLRRQLAVFGPGGQGQLSLVAPIDGVVVDTHATLGEMATPEMPAFIITDPTKVFVRGYVPELEIAKVLSGSAVVVRLHAFPDLTMHGTITYIAPSLDEQTRSLPIRVSLDTPDPRLRSGLFGSVELIGGTGDERVLAVPTNAVATVDGQDVVFVPSDEPNTFKAQPVLLGRRASGFFEIRSGLSEGARLALSGAFTLKSALKSGELSEGHEH